MGDCLSTIGNRVQQLNKERNGKTHKVAPFAREKLKFSILKRKVRVLN